MGDHTPTASLMVATYVQTCIQDFIAITIHRVTMMD
jgi:hypothetical protein